MPTVTIKGGETVWYKKTGHGPAVLHIHGSAFGHRNFEKMTPPMSKDWEVQVYAGTGFTDSSPDFSTGVQLSYKFGALDFGGNDD